MKFLNLETGYSFDGLWTDDQSRGYIFWFPHEQSTGLTYSMPICILTESDKPLHISIEDNDIFKFPEFKKSTCDIDGYSFDGELMDWVDLPLSIKTAPEQINNDYYAHYFNVLCNSKNEGECVCKINIGDAGYIRIGADFYREYEPTQINLSTFGVEIPETVQKAIYDSNVHEDFTDNILINRKFKELLSNYWDIVANKGSYRSLKNSLDWFEWGDALRMREIWKRNEADRTMFDDTAIMSLLENKVEDSFTNFIKTTFVSLYCAMQKETDTYDSEYNPVLEDVVLKWSRNDIQLKLSMLAQYFGIYFMPIHMSILHATIEDTVFTNAIKSVYGTSVKRDDCFGDFNYVECNVKDDALFKMGNVRAQVSDTTKFAVRYPNKGYFGVDPFPSIGIIKEDNLKTFSTQYYTGPGVIVPFDMTIPNQTEGDFLKETIVIINGHKYVFNDLIRCNKDGEIRVRFSLLIKEAAQYTVLFNFILTSGKTLTRMVKFAVEDTDNVNINIYKVRAKDDSNGFTPADFLNTENSKYFFKIQDTAKSTQYLQYLPYMLPTDDRYNTYNGIKLSRTIVVKADTVRDDQLLFLRGLMSNDFLEFAKYDTTDADAPKIAYLIFVSKRFYAETPNDLYDNMYYYDFDIIRNDLGFYPQFHYLERLDGKSIDDYTVNQYEALCCAAEINCNGKIQDFRYGHMIDSSEWTFTNSITGTQTEFPSSSRSPFIASSTGCIDSGYYDIKFRYSLTDGNVNECILNSGFRIKPI